MALDVDNLGPAVDLDAIDFSKLDKGDNLPETKVDAPRVEEAKAEEAEVKVEPEAKGEEAKAEPETKGEESKPRDEKGRFAEVKIPKARFDEAVGKERDAREAAERRAAELERRLAEQQQMQQQSQGRSETIAKLDEQISQMEGKYTELLVDGKTEEALKLMVEIRTLNRQVVRLESQEESTTVVSQTFEAQRFDAAVARLEADHPILNPKSEVYDDDVVQMILLVQRDMVQRQAMPPSDALVLAAEKILARLTPPKAEAKPEGLGRAEAEERTKKAVEASLAAQRAQPASMKDAGIDSDKLGEKGLPDVSKMSAEEFAALPETTKARLRGDLL